MGLREFLNPKSGKMEMKTSFIERGWRARSVPSLFTNIDKVLATIPKEEHFNLYYTAATVSEEKTEVSRQFVEQDIIPFDIDGIDDTKVGEYFVLVSDVLGLDRHKTGCVFTGNGLQIIIQISKPFTDVEYFERTRPIYKAICGRINQALYKAGLQGNADTSVWSGGRLLRLPNTTNIKKNKGIKQGYMVQNFIEPVEFSIYEASKLPEVKEGEHIHPKSFAKLPDPDTKGVLEGCDFLKYCMANQDKVSEPQWYAMLSIVARLEKGSELAHKFSEKHPDYNPDVTDTKIGQALEASGPRTCDNIDTLWDGCKACPNYGQCKSPIQIKSEDYVSTKETGFYNVTLDRDGTPKRGRPNYDDLVKYYRSQHEYVTMEEANIVYTFNGKYWVDESRNKIHNFAERHFDPSPSNSMCMEFESKLKRTQLRRQDWFHVTDQVNFQNGVLDLTTMQLKQHSVEYGFKNVLPFEYDPHASCPRFDQFLDEITLGRKDIQHILIEYMGYSLMGVDPALGQKALILFGEGSNGKSVFIEILRSLAGEGNYSTLSIGNEINKLENRYQLSGKLFNISEETPTSAMAENSIFKALVSGGEVQARKLYCDPYSMKNYAKIILACNKLPKNNDLSHGMFRRLIIIPFEAMFTEDNRDVYLVEKLKKELSGIFNLAMQGYTRLAKNKYKFTESEVVTKSAKNYMRDNDTILLWLEDECGMVPQAISPIANLYSDYSFYCERMGYIRENASNFGKRIKDILHKVYNADQSYKGMIQGKQQRGYKGIALINSQSSF